MKTTKISKCLADKLCVGAKTTTINIDEDTRKKIYAKTTKESIRNKKIRLEDIGKSVSRLFAAEIYAVFISTLEDPNDLIVFDTDFGVLAFGVWGAHSTESWFSEIRGIEYLINNTILNTEISLAPTVNDTKSRRDVDDFYVIKLTTDKGVCSIFYRNSRYFSCKVSEISEIPGEIPPPEALVEIKGDGILY